MASDRRRPAKAPGRPATAVRGPAPCLAGVMVAARRLRAEGAIDHARAVERTVAELRALRALVSALTDLVAPETLRRAELRAARTA